MQALHRRSHLRKDSSSCLTFPTQRAVIVSWDDEPEPIPDALDNRSWFSTYVTFVAKPSRVMMDKSWPPKPVCVPERARGLNPHCKGLPSAVGSVSGSTCRFD